MIFGHDFDLSHDAASKHLHDAQSLVAYHLPSDATVPASHDATKDASSPIALEPAANHVPQAGTTAAYKPPQDTAFDFSKVEPHVVEHRGPNYHTVTKTWHRDSSTHTGAGSQSWSSSSASASADVVPNPDSTDAA